MIKLGKKTHFFTFCIKKGLITHVEKVMSERYPDWTTAANIADIVGSQYMQLPLDTYRVCRILQYLKANNKVEYSTQENNQGMWRIKTPLSAIPQ